MKVQSWTVSQWLLKNYSPTWTLDSLWPSCYTDLKHGLKDHHPEPWTGGLNVYHATPTRTKVSNTVTLHRHELWTGGIQYAHTARVLGAPPPPCMLCMRGHIVQKPALVCIGVGAVSAYRSLLMGEIWVVISTCPADMDEVCKQFYVFKRL